MRDNPGEDRFPWTEENRRSLQRINRQWNCFRFDTERVQVSEYETAALTALLSFSVSNRFWSFLLLGSKKTYNVTIEDQMCQAKHPSGLYPFSSVDTSSDTAPKSSQPCSDPWFGTFPSQERPCVKKPIQGFLPCLCLLALGSFWWLPHPVVIHSFVTCCINNNLSE